MNTLDLRTNEKRLETILRAMTADIPVCEDWQSRLRYRRLYTRPTGPEVKRRAVGKRKIAWDRVLLLAIALACAATYQVNAGLERQFQLDSQTVYRNVLSR